jgi:hypothetical protein
MVKGPDLILCGADACADDGARQCQEIQVTVPLVEMKGKCEVQTISLQGILMEPVLD